MRIRRARDSSFRKSMWSAKSHRVIAKRRRISSLIGKHGMFQRIVQRHLHLLTILGLPQRIIAGVATTKLARFASTAKINSEVGPELVT